MWCPKPEEEFQSTTMAVVSVLTGLTSVVPQIQRSSPPTPTPTLHLSWPVSTAWGSSRASRKVVPSDSGRLLTQSFPVQARRWLESPWVCVLLTEFTGRLDMVVKDRGEGNLQSFQPEPVQE